MPSRPIKQACRYRSGPISPFKIGNEDPISPSREQSGQIGLSRRERQLPQIFTIQGEDIEGIEPHFVVMLAGVQGVEIDDSIDAEYDRFAINDELLVTVLECRVHDPRISATSEKSRRHSNDGGRGPISCVSDYAAVRTTGAE
jgi:hypothetical protein